MKLFIVLIFLLPNYLFSQQKYNAIEVTISHYDEEKNVKKDIKHKEEPIALVQDIKVQKKYEEGLKYYKDRDFKNSYDIFSKIYLDKLSDINFNFYFARSAYETGHYEIALAAFERVEIQDESNLRNKLEMARTYFMLKMYKESEFAFRTVLNNPNIPDNVRTSIELSLSKVSRVQQKSFTYATVMLDMIYDSNVNYGSVGDYEYSGITLDQVDEEGDTAFQVYSSITNIYDIGDRDAFALKNNFSFYLKNYSDLDAYDVMYFAYTPSLLYKETKYTAEMILGIDTMWLGDEKYLSTIFVMPRLEYSHSNTLKSISYIKYQKKMFEQEDQYDLDAHKYEFSYGIQNILSPRSYLFANSIATKETKVRDTNIYVNYNEYKLGLTYANQFSSNFGIDLYAQPRLRTYHDYSSGFDSIRKDIGGIGSAALTMKLMQTLRLKIKTSYEYVNSNQDRFSYQKHTTSAGLIKTY